MSSIAMFPRIAQHPRSVSIPVDTNRATRLPRQSLSGFPFELAPGHLPWNSTFSSNGLRKLTFAGNKVTMPITKTFLPRYVQAATEERTIKWTMPKTGFPQGTGLVRAARTVVD